MAAVSRDTALLVERQLTGRYHRPVAVNNRNVDAGVLAKFDTFLPALVKAKPKGDVTRSSLDHQAGLSARNRQYLEFVRGIGTVHPDFRQVHPDLPGE